MEIPLEDVIDRVAFCDPSGGKQKIKKQRARSAIVVVAQDAMTRVFVLHAWADHCSTDRLYDAIFEKNELYKPRVFGIEANGLQSLFGDGIRRESRIMGHRIPVVPVLQPTKLEKTFRNRTALQPLIAEGRLFLQEHHHELWDELRTHPMSPQFDLADALATAVALLPKRVVMAQEDIEEKALAQYLRRSGAAPHVIEQRIAAHRAKRRRGELGERALDPNRNL